MLPLHLDEIARQAKNAKTVSTVATAVQPASWGVPENVLQNVLQRRFSGDVLETNLLAAQLSTKACALSPWRGRFA